MTFAGTWYPPTAGTGGFLLDAQLFFNPPFAPMTDHDPNGIDRHEPGAKLDALKPRPNLVLGGFSRALAAVTHVGTYGAIKYTPRGWEAVPYGVERYSEAMMRHWLAEQQGIETDAESDFSHAAHLAWNALARLELMLRGQQAPPAVQLPTPATQPAVALSFDEPLGEGIALRMLLIPAGEFLMGSPETEPGRSECGSKGPQHLVRLQSFYMADTPITQAQWRAVIGSNSSHFYGEPDSDRRPVEQVGWHDAMEFCRRLSERTGRTYTLPTEAQWEYACRAGTTTPFSFGETISTRLANYDGSSAYADGLKGEYREQTTPVGMFSANAWGLYDMHGNVWEWCLDNWHDNYEGAPGDGSAWLDDNVNVRNRLLRGGSWEAYPWRCRSACRVYGSTDLRHKDVGFRVCCLPPVQASLTH